MTVTSFPGVPSDGVAVAGADAIHSAGHLDPYVSPSVAMLAALSDGEVRDAVLTWSGRVAAGAARLLAYIGELDARDAWGGEGLLSCAHWLSWRCGLSLAAGYERVRVARSLRDLPHTFAEFLAGRLSYSQVRAITRAATSEDEQQWLQLARVATGSQLDRLVRGVRRVRRIERDEREPYLAADRMASRVRYDDDGSMVLTVRLPAEDGALVLAAIEGVRAELDRRRGTGGETDEPTACGQDPSAEERTSCGQDSSAEERTSLPVVQGSAALRWSDGEADAEGGPDSSAEGHASPQASAPSALEFPRTIPSRFVDGQPRYGVPLADRPQPATIGQAVLQMARDYLDRQRHEHPQAARRSRSKLQLLVDPLSGWARLPDGELLPAKCTAPLLREAGGWALRPLTPLDLTVHDLGRTAREPDLALRELLGRIDGERCRFPACSRKRKLHAHHVLFWSKGGRTDLANLVLLCSRHHTLVHQDGYQLTLHPDRTLDVSTFDGQPIPQRSPLPWKPAGDLDPDGHLGAGTLPMEVRDGSLDLGHAVWVLMQHAA